MKVLRLYDHLGELKKEFPIYVEGQDFKWLASVPEVIWLGTISLEEVGKEPEAEPTPETGVAEQVRQLETLEEKVAEAKVELEEKPELEGEEGELREEVKERLKKISAETKVAKEEVKEETIKVKCSLCGWEGTRDKCPFGHDDVICPECGKETIEEIKEVKDDSGKRSPKRKRVKRVTPPGSA